MKYVYNEYGFRRTLQYGNQFLNTLLSFLPRVLEELYSMEINALQSSLPFYIGVLEELYSMEIGVTATVLTRCSWFQKNFIVWKFVRIRMETFWKNRFRRTLQYGNLFFCYRVFWFLHVLEELYSMEIFCVACIKIFLSLFQKNFIVWK